MSNYQSRIKDMVLISLFAAMIAVSSYITIPIPLVPITAQTLVIMLSGSILNTFQSASSVLIYLMLGAVGLPVFAKGTSGLGVLFGATGGYLFGFLLAVIIINLIKGNTNNIFRLAAANLIGGVAVVYAIGVPWLAVMTGMGLAKAFAAGALYFIAGDIIKVILATVIGYAINKRLKYII
ncbi:MAG: biotin transporter BioY [Bacillota bacterium]